MKRTNRNIKLLRIIKVSFIFFLIQLLIIALFVTTLIQRQQITHREIETTSFVPDKVEKVRLIALGRHTRRKSDVYIYFDSVKYKVGVEYFQRYNDNELVEKLPNEQLTVLYEKNTRDIVDLRSDKRIYFTMDDYNDEQRLQLVLGIIFLSIAELILLSCIIFYFLYATKFMQWLSVRIKKLKKKKRGRQSRNTRNIRGQETQGDGSKPLKKS